jgi:alanine racemase
MPTDRRASATARGATRASAAARDSAGTRASGDDSGGAGAGPSSAEAGATVPVAPGAPGSSSAEARDLLVGPIEARLAAAGLPPLPRSAWLEIDVDALVDNARELRRLLPSGTDLGVVVKADGYGHGIEVASRAAIEGGADLLVVATLDEALLLRAAGIEARILVTYPVPGALLPTAVEADLDLVAADDASVAALVTFLQTRPPVRADPAPAASASREPRVHLGIDTGMGRGGIRPDGAAAAAGRLLDGGLTRLAGTWSHLATPEDPAMTALQVAAFEEALASLAAAGIHPGRRSLDASIGLLTGAAPAYDLVRVGLAFYGVVPRDLDVPAPTAPVASRLRQALTLRARATTVTELPSGATVGYGGTWRAARPSVVATLPLGYADGYARAYAAAAWGVIRGHRAPVIGRISSDAITLDVTDVPGFTAADEVVLLAASGGAMTVHDLVERRGSIAWEVLDAFTPRLPRVSLSAGRPIAVRALTGGSLRP